MQITAAGLLLVLFGVFGAGCGASQPTARTPPNSELDALYADYDREFLRYLAKAEQVTGRRTMVVEPLSARYTVPKRLRLQGTPFDLGATVGHVARQAGRPLPSVGPSARARNEAIVALYRRIDPRHLEVVRGIASVYGMAPAEVDMVHLEYDFFVGLWTSLLRYDRFSALTDFGSHGDTSPTAACSLASYLVGGHHLVGRNFDNDSDRPHYFATSEIEGGYRSKGNVIYSLTHWAVDGLNERGLSINSATNGGDYDLHQPYPAGPAVFSGHLARIVIDTCADVDQALALIGSVRVWFPNEGLHWLLADASGRSVVVEFDRQQQMVVLDRPGPWELATNTALQYGDDYLVSVCPRFARAKPWLEAGIRDQSEMLALMRALRPGTGYPVRTLWTSVMDLESGTVEMHYRLEYDDTYAF